MQVTHIPNIEGSRAALWDVTGTCNLRCKHCYQFDRYGYASRTPYARDLSTDDALQVLERLAEAGITDIHFLGGEPLLRQDLCTLVADAHRRGIYVSINTNGMPLTVARMRQLVAAGVNQVMVSLDGATAATNDAIRGKGTFNVVWRNLRANLAAGGLPTLGITFTATSSNAHEIGDLFGLALEHGLPSVHIVPVHEAGNYVNNSSTLGSDPLAVIHGLERALATYAEALRGRVRVRIDLRLWTIEVLNRKFGIALEPDPVGVKCQGGKKFVVIQADGRLVPCTASADPAFNAPLTEYEAPQPELVQLMGPGGIDRSRTLDGFYRFQRAPATFAALTPCDRCRFVAQCQPCPLEFWDDRTVAECMWAEREEAGLGERLLRSVVRLGAGFELHGGATLVRAGDGAAIAVGAMLGGCIAGSQTRPLGRVLAEEFRPGLSPAQTDEITGALGGLVALGVLRAETPEGAAHA